jgi:hypothetical protein
MDLNATTYNDYNEYDAEYEETHPDWHANSTNSPPRNDCGVPIELDLTTPVQKPAASVPPVPVTAATVQQRVVQDSDFAFLDWSTCDFDSSGVPIGFLVRNVDMAVSTNK